jgi:hypothetical protein
MSKALVRMLELDLEVAGFEVDLVDKVETTGVTMYILRRFPPPQYSDLLALQIILQPLMAGSVLDWLTEPAFMTFPQ